MLSIFTPLLSSLVLIRLDGARLPAASTATAGSCLHSTDASIAQMHEWRQAQAEPVRMQTLTPTRSLKCTSGGRHRRRAEPVRMQTLTPTRPSETGLPSTWDVPDTFTFTAPSTTSKEPPLYKVTLFKSSSASDQVYVANSLLEIVAGMDIPRAKEIAKKVNSIGFALVGVWVEEVAEAYADALRDRKLVCDVSEQ